VLFFHNFLQRLNVLKPNRFYSFSIAMVLFSTACVENNYFTGPETPTVSKVELLKLPRFANSEVTLGYYQGSQFLAELAFDAPAKMVEPCRDLEVSTSGTSARVMGSACATATDPSGQIFYRLWIVYSLEDLGVTDVTVTPRSNPAGRSAFRVNVVHPEKG